MLEHRSRLFEASVLAWTMGQVQNIKQVVYDFIEQAKWN
jgi:hypothetical protein